VEEQIKIMNDLVCNHTRRLFTNFYNMSPVPPSASVPSGAAMFFVAVAYTMGMTYGTKTIESI
jgi:hypothetical protein